MSKELPRLPVVELFRGQTLREVIDVVLTEFDDDEKFRTGEILDHINTSREALRPFLVGEGGERVGILVQYGILDVQDPEAKIPHYMVADSPVIECLRKWDEVPLTELFEYTGAQKLVTFFLAVADPEESYSINGITTDTPIGYSAVSNHIDTLVDAGLVEVVEGARGDEYRVDTDSSLYGALRELNDAIYDTTQQRRQGTE